MYILGRLSVSVRLIINAGSLRGSFLILFGFVLITNHHSFNDLSHLVLLPGKFVSRCKSLALLRIVDKVHLIFIDVFKLELLGGGFDRSTSFCRL